MAYYQLSHFFTFPGQSCILAFVELYPSCYIVDDHVVGFFGAPTSPFAWVEFWDEPGHPLHPEAKVSEEQKASSLELISSESPDVNAADAKNLVIVSSELLQLCEQYGVPFRVSISDKEFAYSSHADVRRFHTACKDDIIHLKRLFLAFLRTWVDVNIKTVNPYLTSHERSLIEHLLKSFINNIFPEDVEKAGLTMKYLQMVRYVIVASEQFRKLWPNSAREAQMKQYGFHYIW